MEFLVRWKGYNNSEDEWLKEYDMPHALEAIQEFRENERLWGRMSGCGGGGNRVEHREVNERHNLGT